MTSRECRALWQALKFQYADIEPYDLDALQGYIALECAESCRKGETPRYTIPRCKNDSLCCKMNPDGGILRAYLKIDCPGQWNGREAVSFNSDGFIGFCGWADSQNSQPFYRAWRAWCCNYMTYKLEDPIVLIMNCGECNMHMIGPDGVADSTDDAESVARDGLIRQWNTRWTPSEGDGHGVAH